MLTMPALRQGRLLLYFPFSHLQIQAATILAKIESKKELSISIKDTPLSLPLLSSEESIRRSSGIGRSFGKSSRRKKVPRFTAMASAYTGRKVRGDTAMTGEITLTGEVLPIGGVKEKVLAASQFGIRQILLPEKNKRDMEEIPQSVRKKLEFIYVKNVDDVLAHALMK